MAAIVIFDKRTNSMKKLYTLFTICLSLFLNERTFSQTFSLYAPDTVVYGPANGSDLPCDGNSIVNHTANSIVMDVVRLQDVDIAGTGWASSFCLDLNCFAPFVDSSRFTLLGNDSTLFIPHFIPTSTPDSQTVYFKFKMVSSPNTTYYQSFHGVTQLNFGVNEAAAYRADVKIYPSPVTAGSDFNMNVSKVISKTENLSLVIYNMYGSEVRTIYNLAEGNNTLNLTLATGIYSYSLTAGDVRIHSGKMTVIR